MARSQCISCTEFFYTLTPDYHCPACRQPEERLLPAYFLLARYLQATAITQSAELQRLHHLP
jgi:hypothetical protein